MALEKINKNAQGVPDGTYTLVSGGTLWADCPLGTLLPFMGAENKIPAGWCLADGRALSRTKYADLFAIIGTAYGAGDGSTTFNIADMRESVPKGAGLTGKTVGAHLDADGLAVGEFLDDRFQGHNHNSTMGAYTVGSGSFLVPAITGAAITDSLPQFVATDGTNGTPRAGATTEVKSVGVNYITRIEMVGVPADFLAEVEDVVEEVISPYYHKCIYARTNTSGSELVKTLALEDGKCYTIEGYQGDNYKRTRVYLFSGTIRTINEISSATSPFTLSSSNNVLTITFANWSYNQCRIYEESPANNVTIG